MVTAESQLQQEGRTHGPLEQVRCPEMRKVIKMNLLCQLAQEWRANVWVERQKCGERTYGSEGGRNHEAWMAKAKRTKDWWFTGKVAVHTSAHVCTCIKGERTLAKAQGLVGCLGKCLSPCIVRTQFLQPVNILLLGVFVGVFKHVCLYMSAFLSTYVHIPMETRGQLWKLSLMLSQFFFLKTCLKPSQP